MKQSNPGAFLSKIGPAKSATGRAERPALKLLAQSAVNDNRKLLTILRDDHREALCGALVFAAGSFSGQNLPVLLRNASIKVVLIELIQ